MVKNLLWILFITFSAMLFMEDIVMDRKTLRALASDKKREIMKLLAKSQLTLSDISQKMGMSPSSVKEHLDGLRAAGLIEQKDEGRKWKYYVLTKTGSQLLSPVETKILFVLSLSGLAIISSLWSLLVKFQSGESPYLMKAAYDTAESAGSYAPNASNTVPGLMEITSFPHLEIALLVFSSVIFAICIGYVLKRRS
jgi:DNA-binding transcriptional ArsR family regulator